MEKDWYKDVIIYELHVKAFKDSNGDGIGDFKGAISKLDYLHDLGIDCIWLLPMYPSPGKDDGYDIEDYYTIHKDLGTLDDFKEFVKEAHKRDIKIIIELVLNHTSDKHPWFIEATKGEDSPHHDYYVWADNPDKYKEARVIFVDSEASNWTYHNDCKKYYWHRFYHHQPDLNYDNPEVKEEMKKIIKHWLDIGIDGFRFDAVPYLYQREGTNCENLPETHNFIKEIRKFIDDNYENKVMLAEVNQWPNDLLEYFGDDDEFHMAYNFPLMPRMFMALMQEHHGPIVDIMKSMPSIPENCQWATFLRNHDELTLEMVTDEERDYMYLEYAKDPKMKLNLGIRRRLTPLMENDQRKVIILYAMLFALPGSPIIYYGDEIAMGDNIYLGDRNGVRTPMHWEDGRNAGFSEAKPSKLYAPVIADPEYHYSTVNVEVETNKPSSIYNFIKKLIEVKKQNKCFGRGSLEFIYPENKSVLVFTREYNSQEFLFIFNLSKKSQPVEINLQLFNGKIPREIFGNIDFPRIGELPYFITLNPYGFYFFELI